MKTEEILLERIYVLVPFWGSLIMSNIWFTTADNKIDIALGFAWLFLAVFYSFR